MEGREKEGAYWEEVREKVRKERKERGKEGKEEEKEGSSLAVLLL